MTIDDRDDEGLNQDPDEPQAPAPKPKGRQRPPPLGTGEPLKFARTSNEADSVWSELVIWLPKVGLTPYDVYAQVKRITPPAPDGGPFPVGQIRGQAIVGGDGIAPGQAFIDYMIRYIHLPTMQGPAKYDVEFRRTANGEIISKTQMNLPDRQVCLAMIAAAEQAQMASPGGPGLGAPPIRSAPLAPPPASQGWVPPAPPPGYFAAPAVPPEMWGMMQTMMAEAFSAAREGRQPVMPQPGVAQPPPIDRNLLVQEVTAGVLVALQKAGIGVAPVQAPPPVQASPGATNTVSGLAGSVEKMMGSILESAVKTLGANLEKSVKQSMGMGAPGVAEEEAEPEAPAEPEKPEDMLPWQAAATGATWGDGRPVNFAKNKETGNIDPMGLIMTNPVIGEKAMQIATGIGEAVQDAIKKFTAAPGTAQVVKRIPQNAADAGVGYVPPKKPDGEGSSGAPAAANGGWGAP
jgi:hypothetical protein